MSAICPQHVVDLSKSHQIWLKMRVRADTKMTLTQDFCVGDCRHLPHTSKVAPLASKNAPSDMSDISSSVPSPHDMHAVNRANAAAVTLSTPSSTQATVSTITTAPSGVSVMIDFTGGGGGDGDESGGEEAGMDEEQLQPLRSVVDCAYIKARTVNDGKDG